jgi:hypothetical protein
MPFHALQLLSSVRELREITTVEEMSAKFNNKRYDGSMLDKGNPESKDAGAYIARGNTAAMSKDLSFHPTLVDWSAAITEVPENTTGKRDGCVNGMSKDRKLRRGILSRFGIISLIWHLKGFRSKIKHKTNRTGKRH